MKALTITIDPLGWVRGLGLAVRNTLKSLAATLSNPRLWIGVGASFVVHGVVFFLSLVTGVRAISQTESIFPVVSIPSGTYHPRVAEVVEPGTRPGSTDETVYPQKTSVVEELQAVMSNPVDAVDVSGLEPHGILKVNPAMQQSVEEILQRVPLVGKRNIGTQTQAGLSFGTEPIKELGPYQVLPQTPLVKPSPTPEPAPIAQNAQASSKARTFTLEGDLHPDDILRSVLPPYPAFARAKGLSNVYITLDFTVNSSGSVSPVMLIQRSTGYPEWDKLVKSTLLKWRFKSSDKITRKGRITFRFVLK